MIKKKVLLVVLSAVFFLNCSVLFKTFKYYPIVKDSNVHILGSLVNEQEEYSPLGVLKIEDKRNGTYTSHKIKLLENKIKIVKAGKEYVIPYSKSEDYDDIYIYIRVFKNGVNITDGDFTAYIGKVQLDTGEIVDVPPLHFKKHIYIQRFKNPLVLADPNGKFEQYYNTVEEYKKNGWKGE